MPDANENQNENEEQAIDKVREFLQNGCGCSRGAKGGPCSNQFEMTPIIQNEPQDLDFSTIDAVTLASLREEDPAPPCSPVVELPAPSTPNRVGEELIRTCVTQRKVTKV